MKVLTSGSGVDANTVLLMHCNGTDGSTTFIEESGLTVTPFGAAQIDTAQSFFGGASALFDGASSYLNVPGATHNLGTGNFVLECRVRFAAFSSYQCCMNFRLATPGIFWGVINNLPLLYLGGNAILGAALSANTWYHYALVRSSGVDRLFIDGVQTGGDYADANNYPGPSATQIGGEPANPFNGWMDEIRISKGTDRGWFSGFTPPASPYSGSGGQIGALAASGIVMRSMILFDFPEGLFGFWTGGGILNWNTINFVGARSLISVERDDESMDLTSNGVVARLRANPEAGITPDLLATIENYDYRNRPVTIYRVLFDVASLAMIDDPIVEWRGIVDQFTHGEGADGDYVLTGRFVSRAIDYTRRGPMVRSSAHQNLISAGDKFFDFTGFAGSANIYFGTKVPKKLGSQRSQAGKL